jgi:diguanylate cyclase (GGDEF)-like protein/PAS domain S-box-containing protein
MESISEPLKLSDCNFSRVIRNIWLSAGLCAAIAISFAVFYGAERQIDRARELRLRTFLLADELRQSSDDLTRMARSYVITGDPIYRQHHQEILDILNGKKARPEEYQNVYWDLVLLNDRRPRPSKGQPVPLLELMRDEGLGEAELAELTQAKTSSDQLASYERLAMKRVGSGSPVSAAGRLEASRILNDATYHQAKAGVMGPIGTFHRMMDQRTLETIHAAETTAAHMIQALGCFGLLLIYLLWQVHRSLHQAIGGSVEELLGGIARLYSRDFSSTIPVAAGMESSMLAMLSATQIELARIDAERNSAEAKIHRTGQLYAALSQCNQAIVRCSDEAELFPIICRDAVNFGGMKMAWIGLVDQQNKELRPAAFYGSGTDYLDGLRISVAADHPYSHGPTGMAIRENQAFWCQDFQRDPATAPWREWGARFGWGASASLPLHRNGAVVGAFTLYASKAYAFDEAARNLLLEMAIDIDYALNSYELEAQRKKAEYELRKLSQIVEQSPDAIYITDREGNIEYANTAFVQHTGYGLAEVVGKKSSVLKSGKTPEETYQEMWKHIAGGTSWQGELINKRKDDTVYVDLVKISPIRQSDGQITHYMAIAEDITERKQVEQRVQFLANFDALTGLPNRHQLADRAKYALSLAKRNRKSLALMFLDIDNFKDINDTFGHTFGDALLVEFANRLKLVLREEDIVSRFGGDEFILLLPDNDGHGAHRTADRLLDAISEPYHIGQNWLNLTASIGIAIYPDDGLDLESLFRHADTAMYRVKQEGRHGYRFFTAEMQARSARNMQLGNALHDALEHDQFRLHYQPQLSLEDGRIVGAEALLRWHHPELGAVSPMEFIPVVEESGLILQIGEWVLRHAIQQARLWLDSGFAPFVMSVNLSAVQFRHPDLPNLIAGILDEVGLPADHLGLELTEGTAMHDPQTAIAVMEILYQRGIHMSIDDFGTGHSSLSYLKKFHNSKLKIDQSFVRDIGSSPEDRAIVSAIISLAKNLGLRTIAEGVETEEQLAFLHEQGCEEAQGYYYSEPLPAEQFAAFVKSGRPDPA